jgi:hypothetical protein
MTEPAIMRVHVALKELRDAMTDVRYAHPAYMPGQGPSAADNCKMLLASIDWYVNQIEIYLGDVPHTTLTERRTHEA